MLCNCLFATRVRTGAIFLCPLTSLFYSLFYVPVEFKEPRVIELWEIARRSNLSEDELDSLKVTCL